MELVKEGWITRYLDIGDADDGADVELSSDSSILLIADLLCRCVDAIGLGGWLINDTWVAAGAVGDGHIDSTDFLAALRLEISAALEGVQEAVYAVFSMVPNSTNILARISIRLTHLRS